MISKADEEDLDGDDDRSWLWPTIGVGAAIKTAVVTGGDVTVQSGPVAGSAANADVKPAKAPAPERTRDAPAKGGKGAPSRTGDANARPTEAVRASVAKDSPVGGSSREPPRQFIRCALSGVQTRVFQHLQTALARAGIPYFLGGAAGSHVKRINLRTNDAARLIGVLREARRSVEFYVQSNSSDVQTLEQFAARSPKSATLLVLERSVIAGGFNQVHCSAIEIALWDKSESYSKEFMQQSDLPHRSYAKIREKTIAQYFADHVDTDSERNGDVYACTFPVDIVYTWVNDQDQAWLERKNRALAANNRPVAAGSRAQHNERFRNRDELKYSFRSVEMFAPFVRKIFLVTDDQTPDWLDTSHPRVEVVSHRSIYRDPKVLPTFNSSGIETQLHHIPGLSDHFLYFNDDFFLGDVVSAEDFFLGNGAIRCFPSDQYANENDIDEEREEYVVADRNAIEMFRSSYGSFGRNIMLHVPYPSHKRLLTDMERGHQAAFDTCASQQFRSMRDIRPIAFMQYHFGFRDRLVVPSEITHRYLALWKPVIETQLDNVLKSRKFKTFCINDVGIPPERERAVTMAVQRFLQAYFPFKSSFEK